MGALVAQGVEGLGHQCSTLAGPFKELKYCSPIERHYLALIFAMQMLRHYLLAHYLNLVTYFNPLKKLFAGLLCQDI